MTFATPNSTDSLPALLQRIGADCFRSVLSQAAGFAIAVEMETEEAVAADTAQDQSGVWAQFAVSKALSGNMAILSAETGALPLAQILMSEPVDLAAPFDKDRRNAYEELLRQVVGQVATGLRGPAGGEVEIKPSGSDPPDWPDASRTGIRITGEKLAPIRLVFVVSPALAESLRPPQPMSATAPAPAPNAPAAQPAVQPAVSAARSSNLELLLDVKLDATIRFGQKQMLLRDVLQLHPGAAIALDRKVEEPVELLVGGRMVARGEVVIVDGNYGLRITEIVSPQERIESLRPSL